MTDHLTPREWDVLYCAAHGLTIDQTALVMELSPMTVSWYRRAILEKLNAVNTVQAVYIAGKEIENHRNCRIDIYTEVFDNEDVLMD